MHTNKIKIPFAVVFIFAVFLFGFFLGKIFTSVAPITNNNISLEYPLKKYSFLSLQEKSQGTSSKILLTKQIKETKDFTQYSIRFTTDGKNVSGLLNLPIKNGTSPLVVLIRGYVDQKKYTSGEGTIRVGEYLASNGFITIAPDFLGYADSDSEASDVFESRFQTYTTVLDLLASLKSIPQWDGKNLFIWGHSNGGHISLAILEITKRSIPTVLWAPVSKPFPYSILYYTDDSDDGGKLIRKELSKFESLYNVDDYSITNYFNDISAPIQIHQGSADDAVPKTWTDNLSNNLKRLGKDVEYFVYPGANHNLTPGWDSAVQKTLEFYTSHVIE